MCSVRSTGGFQGAHVVEQQCGDKLRAQCIEGPAQRWTAVNQAGG